MMSVLAFLRKPGWNVVLVAVFAFQWGGYFEGMRKSGDWPILMLAIFFIAIAYFLGLFCWVAIDPHGARGTRPKPIARNIEDRLDELERLKRRDMVAPEEYAAKRQEILKDL